VAETHLPDRVYRRQFLLDPHRLVLLRGSIE
jgi:hypothetical protein